MLHGRWVCACVFVGGSYGIFFSLLSILKSMEFGTSDSVQVKVTITIYRNKGL